MASAEDSSPYDLLGIPFEATDTEIKTAYRQRSRRVHPDRNPNDKDAARKFHELNQAYELLLDPLRRLALDAKLRAVEARKQRFAKYDSKRKHLLEELEERERTFKKARAEQAAVQRAQAQETEKIKDEGRRLREERERELRLKEEEAEREAAAARATLEPPPLGQLDTTVKLRYPITAHPGLTTAEALGTFLARYGPTDISSIVISMKPPKKAPHKPPKFATALVPFQRIGDAHAAVCASGRADYGMGDVDVSWAGSAEPEIVLWLKKMGKLGAGSQPVTPANEPAPARPSSGLPQQSPSASVSSGPFSSFPSTFSYSLSGGTYGLNYEAMTMMRLRQAERERLEREILEQEAS
ncbi:DnaJ domain-containing protein [Vararia minispora EC-137]|uniref:DnaJ domain-containing protein n=1 Tax=Vararia minispora EC-137 TaxID=1314806 RepID=A0ACB8QM10_9AGAM|nr:DnaJ domain-containing protein [Vararia minispora EC-137]